jgi:hypothetical protein
LADVIGPFLKPFDWLIYQVYFSANLSPDQSEVFKSWTPEIRGLETIELLYFLIKEKRWRC